MLDFRKYENVPRFQLDRRPGRSRLKLTCPACGKSRCLTPYIDVATGQVVGNEFGRCDHERTCGYDKRPTGKDVGDKDLWISGNKCIRAYRPPVNPDVVNYIPFSEFERTVVPDDRNTVFRFLSSLWGKERVSDVFRRYHVGTMDLWGWKGCCIFWQIDKDFVCRTGKIMDFYIKTDSQGNEIDVKRVKEKDGDNERPHVMFYHSLHARDFLFRQCLFGEHLLSQYPDKVVNLVESEKTAIICAVNKPDELFVATGGLHNLRPEVIDVLKNRKTVAFPDKGQAFETWSKKIDGMMMKSRIKVSDYLQNVENVGDGDDVADLIINNKVKEKQYEPGRLY